MRANASTSSPRRRANPHELRAGGLASRVNPHGRMMHRQTMRPINTALAATVGLAATVACEETIEPTAPEPGVGQVEMRGDVERMYKSGAFRFDIEAGPNEGQEILVLPSTPGLILEEGAEVDVIADLREIRTASFEEETGLRWEDNYEDDFTLEELVVADAVSVAVVD